MYCELDINGQCKKLADTETIGKPDFISETDQKVRVNENCKLKISLSTL